MAALQLQAPTGLDPFAVPSGGSELDAQSAEGQVIEEVARDAYRRWQERAEVLLVQEEPVSLLCGRSLESSSEGLTSLGDLHNRRRFFLINKKFHAPEGLCGAEDEELRQLQTEFESYLDSIHPLPNQMLDELEALAKKLEAEDEQP